ncbi:MAG: hypothetical protein ABI977_37310 [Acidobacteriota bacterium]
MQDFQQILASPDLTWDEGMNFFRGEGLLNNALRRLAADLDAHGIDYNLIGAMALNLHGYQRFTIDIDVLISSEGLQKFQNELVGFGYRPTDEWAKMRFHTTAENVPIDIIIAGKYPGDGKPKSVRFHDPQENYVVINGIKTINLETLINFKLTSGMTAPDRLKDLGDAQELIKIKDLDESFAERLDPFVRDKFIELARAVALAKASKRPDDY